MNRYFLTKGLLVINIRNLIRQVFIVKSRLSFPISKINTVYDIQMWLDFVLEVFLIFLDIPFVIRFQ